MPLLRRAFGGRRVCVTGGAGFIGRRLAEALVDLDATVSIIDDLSNSELENVAALVDRAPDRAPFTQGSILDPAALADALEDAEVVFHLAAVSSLPAASDDPERAFEVNSLGTVRVAQEARLAGAARLIYASTSAVYGDAEAPHVETIVPMPLSPYAASKLSGEFAVTAWARSRGLPGMSLRFFNVFGPRQPAGGQESAVVPAFITKLRAGEAPLVYGDGGQTRDFIHIEDVTLALLLAGAVEKDLAGEVVNIGSGKPITILKLAKRMAQIGGRGDLAPLHERARPGEVEHSWADMTQARELLGFEPVRSLDEALEELVGALPAATPSPE